MARHILAVFTVAGNEAVVATLSATPASFDGWRASMEPCLWTLQRTGETDDEVTGPKSKALAAVDLVRETAA